MGKPSKAIEEFMARFKIAKDEIWEVRAGGAWAIKHAALERVAAEQKITFDRPAVIEHNAADKIAVVCVFGSLGDRQEWSFGEASPANNKNAYCYSMAEKRGKDRVILKLLNAHGALYSESEADEFEQRQNPHVTRPEDIVEATEYDDHGQPIDSIPNGDGEIAPLPKAKARPIYAALEKEIRECASVNDLINWGGLNATRIEALPLDWREILRGQYKEHLLALRSKAAMSKQKEEVHV